jgi:hypothetical protein
MMILNWNSFVRRKASLKRVSFLISVLCIVFGLCNCEPSSQTSTADFYDTYKSILIVREQFPDTSIANPKVRAMLVEAGYSEESFRQNFMELARDDKSFRTTIDSLRNAIRAEADSLSIKDTIQSSNQ